MALRCRPHKWASVLSCETTQLGDGRALLHRVCRSRSGCQTMASCESATSAVSHRRTVCLLPPSLTVPAWQWRSSRFLHSLFTDAACALRGDFATRSQAFTKAHHLRPSLPLTGCLLRRRDIRSRSQRLPSRGPVCLPSAPSHIDRKYGSPGATRIVQYSRIDFQHALRTTSRAGRDSFCYELVRR